MSNHEVELEIYIVEHLKKNQKNVPKKQNKNYEQNIHNSSFGYYILIFPHLCNQIQEGNTNTKAEFHHFRMKIFQHQQQYHALMYMHS